MQALAVAAVSLQIVVWPHGLGAASHTWTLRCGPVGGTLPSAAAACGKLDGNRSLFAPVPPGSMCAALYGGPAVARVTGTFGGRKLTASFRRRDACEVARWKRLAFLFR